MAFVMWIIYKFSGEARRNQSFPQRRSRERKIGFDLFIVASQPLPDIVIVSVRETERPREMPLEWRFDAFVGYVQNI